MQIGGAMASFSSAVAPLPLRPASPTHSRDSSSARDAPRPKAARARDESSLRTPQQRQEQLQIAELASRDRKVRAHEQAHAGVAGVHAGTPSYSYTRGPDGRHYALAGDVAIDLGPVANDPEATLRKMEVVLRAALAPADPSAQDRRVAAQAQAQAQMVQARVELAELQRSEPSQHAEPQTAQAAARAPQGTAPEPALQVVHSAADLRLYRQQDQPSRSGQFVDLRA
jgi:hypothetical protein